MAGHIRCAFRQFDTPTSNLGMTTHPRDLIKQNRNRNHHRGCLHIPSSPPPHTPGPDLESSAGPTAAGPRLLTEWHWWQDLRSELTNRYGEQKGQMMICALTHDDPVKDCTDR